MQMLHDLLLTKPLGDHAMEVVLFISFVLHLLFALLTLGTAMIAVYFFVHSWLSGHKEELVWDKNILRTHLAFKSLAVVLGVAPLLVIQVLWSVPFFTATSLLAPYWLGLTILMVFAFLSLDYLGHNNDARPISHLIFGIFGLCALLVVPAVFTAVLSLMERSDSWGMTAMKGMLANPDAFYHWVFRYLHILGAAAVLGGAFHLFFSLQQEEDRHYHISWWVIIATLFQIGGGILLAFSLGPKLDKTIILTLSIGIFATLLMLGFSFLRLSINPNRDMVSALVFLPIVLFSMLLSRQFLQHSATAPLQNELAQKAVLLRSELAPLDPSIKFH